MLDIRAFVVTYLLSECVRICNNAEVKYTLAFLRLACHINPHYSFLTYGRYSHGQKQGYHQVGI